MGLVTLDRRVSFTAVNRTDITPGHLAVKGVLFTNADAGMQMANVQYSLYVINRTEKDINIP